MTTALTDRKAKWRKAHPGKNRKRRRLDDENQKYKRDKNKKEGKPSETPLVCSKKGCKEHGEVHHVDKDKREILCRQHHQKPHKARGDGPGSNGPGRSNEHDHAGGLVHHSSHNIIKESVIVGIRHSPETPVSLESTKRGTYAVRPPLLANLTKSE